MSEPTILIQNTTKDIEISQFLKDLKPKIEDKFEVECKSITEKAPANSQSGEINIALEIAKIGIPTLLTALLFWVKQRSNYSVEYEDKETGIKTKISELSESEYNKKVQEIVTKNQKPIISIVKG